MTVFAIVMLLTAAFAFGKGANIDGAVRLYDHGEFRQAADLLTESSLSFPDDASVRLWLGKSFMRLHKWDDAVRELEKAVQIEPSNALHHLWLGRAYGNKASRASIFTAFGWARKTVKEFETARSLSPDNLDVRFDLLEFYLEAPGIVGGGKDKAEAEVREIAKLNPQFGRTARGLRLAKDKKWELARKEYEQATLEFPERAESWADLAEFLFDRSDFAGAERSARRALEQRKSYPQAALLLAKARIRQGNNLLEAESALIDLASGPLGDDDPAFDEIHYWLGFAYKELGKPKEARRAFETALRFNPDSTDAKSALSQLR